MRHATLRSLILASCLGAFAFTAQAQVLPIGTIGSPNTNWVYPNPFNKFLNFAYPGQLTPNCKIMVFNDQGVPLSSQILHWTPIVQINTSSLAPNRMYIVRFFTDQGDLVFERRVMKRLTNLTRD